MLTLYTVLRLVHIFSGVFWAGANLMMAGFINPSVKATAPDSGKFMQHLAQKSGFPRSAEIAGWLTVLAGLALYWIVSGGFQPAWITSRYGLALTMGGLLAIVGLVVGYTVQKPAAKRMGALGQEIQASGGPPSPEQVAELQAQQKKLAMGGLWTAILLALAVVGMAIAR